MSPDATTDDRGNEPSRHGYAYFVCSVAALGGFLFGYDTGTFMGAQIFLRDYFHLTAGQFGLAAACVMMGCILSPTVGARLVDRFGGKRVLLFSAMLFMIGGLGTALSPGVRVFICLRIFTGLGIGLASLASPMYIAEIAPASRRGRMVFLYQLAITFGVLAGIVVSLGISRCSSEATCWRWMFGSILVPAGVFALFLVIVPQSPRWLMLRNREGEALATLVRIHGQQAACWEVERIRTSLRREKVVFSDLFRSELRPVLLTGLLLAAFNNWTGMTGISVYFPTLLQIGGYARPGEAVGLTLIPVTINFLVTLVALRLVDRFGRRPLWIGASAAMAVALGLLGLAFQYGLRGPVILVITILVLTPYALALGPIPWLMIPELYPTRIRARAVSLCTTVIWLASFTSVLSFPGLLSVSSHALGSQAGVFWLYAMICVCAFLFGWKLLPETKGKTLEEASQSRISRC